MPAKSPGFLEIFRPNRTADSVAAVDITELKKLGIEALLLDLDNTLVPWHGYDVSNAVLGWLRGVEAQGMKICIVSNTRYPGRLKRLAEKLQVPFVKGRMKPRKSAFRPALKLLGVTPERAAVIGDQLFTDILGGNRLGLFTVLVSPLSRREFFGTKISRVFEKVILKALSPLAGEGTRIPLQQQDLASADSSGAREQSPGVGSQSKSEQ